MEDLMMSEIIEYLRDFNAVTVAIRLLLAMVLGGTIGLERGKQGRAAGMRTHILVCLGSALAAMIGFYATDVLGYSNDPLRIAAQVISGIGFLGVGTIMLKGRFQIVGLTTAAGLWTAAAVGLALGAGFYEGALITFFCSVLTVTVVHRLEYKINKKYSRFGMYVEVRSDEYVRCTIDYLRENFMITDIQVTAPRSATQGNVGIEAVVHNRDFKTSPDAVTSSLESKEHVIYAIESI